MGRSQGIQSLILSSFIFITPFFLFPLTWDQVDVLTSWLAALVASHGCQSLWFDFYTVHHMLDFHLSTSFVYSIHFLCEAEDIHLVLQLYWTLFRSEEVQLLRARWTWVQLASPAPSIVFIFSLLLCSSLWSQVILFPHTVQRHAGQVDCYWVIV